MAKKTIGDKFIYELKEGEDWRNFRGMLIITHPDRPPKIVHKDGTEEAIKDLPWQR